MAGEEGFVELEDGGGFVGGVGGLEDEAVVVELEGGGVGGGGAGVGVGEGEGV